MRAHDTQTRDVTMLDPIRRFLLHLRKHVSDDLRGVVGGAGRAGDIDGDVGEGGPGQGVVEVVFEEVVFRQVG